VVHRDLPAPFDLAEQARVDAFRDAGAADQAVLTNQHRRVGGEDVHFHVVKVQLAAPFGRAAIVADIMVERALPAILELAA